MFAPKSAMTGVERSSGAGPEATAVPSVTRAGGYSCRGVAFAASGTHGRREILRDLDLDIAPGEIVTVVGGSGTGKTTLLRLLGGLLRPTAGSVRLGGEEVVAPPAGAVTVFQDYANALLPWRTVRGNVSLGLEGRGCSRAERDRRVDEALASVGLAERASDRPWQLSGGMQQRVQLARALVLAPRVLLMDEPFGALDAMTKATLQDELLALQARTGATIVFVTHDIEEAIYLGDRVILLGGTPGRIRGELAVDLPRPREQLATKELPAFLTMRHRAAEALGAARHG